MLLDHLAENGVCAIHFTYAKQDFADNYGWPFTKESLFLVRVMNTAKSFPQRLARLIIRSVKKAAGRNVQSTQDPEMQMNPYRLNDLLFMIQSLGVKNVFLEYVDHGGELGVYLFFQKPADK